MTEQLEFKELHLFTRAEAAKVLSISKEKLNQFIHEGLIGIISHDGRIMVPYKSIVNYIETYTVIISQDPSADSKTEISLEDMRNNNSKPAIDSRQLLKKIMEETNG